VVETARLMASSGWPWDAKESGRPCRAIGQAGQYVAAYPDLTAPPLRINPWLVPASMARFACKNRRSVLVQRDAVPPIWRRWSEALARIHSRRCFGALGAFLVADLARLVLGRRFAYRRRWSG